MRTLLSALCLLALLTSATAPAHAGPIAWQHSLNEAVFTQAAREHKFVLLDLHAVWCHWCHVMDENTYGDPAVQKAIAKSYIAISVDADSDPALTSRYGDWGWPATIVLAADQTEIVKRRGYIAPAQMISLLDAIVADPSPGPSVGHTPQLANSDATSLVPKERDALAEAFDSLYDTTNSGWGTEHKYLDANAIEWSFIQLDGGNQLAMTRIRHTLDANRKLIDPVWGGVFQYSDSVDWSSPHYEKLLSFQADDLRLYSDAYARWRRPGDKEAAQQIYGYLTRFLAAPDGGFYVSQDADVSAKLTGHDYYTKDDAGRRAAGMPPIDKHEYAREAGWAIRALCSYYDVFGDEAALTAAERSAKWALSSRQLPGGGFSHAGLAAHTGGNGVTAAGTNGVAAAGSNGAAGAGGSAATSTGGRPADGPFLDDNVSMAQALLALYRSTGQREWLKAASDTLQFVDTNLRDPRGGYMASRPPADARGALREPVRDVGQNAAVVRVANMLQHYTGADQPAKTARHAMKFLTAFAAGAAAGGQFRPEILLADHELSMAPIHITIVGPKDDPAAKSLHAAALSYPTDYLQVDWWDRREGKLPDPTISYPVLPRPAAFACTANACSTPIYGAAEIRDRVHSVLN